MTKRKHEARIRLRDASNALSEEVWQGKWDQLPEIRTKPKGDCTEILEELERRCPGHSLEGISKCLPSKYDHSSMMLAASFTNHLLQFGLPVKLNKPHNSSARTRRPGVSLQENPPSGLGREIANSIARRSRP